MKSPAGAHAPRKFHEIHIAHPSPTTTEAIQRTGKPYDIEREIRGSPPERRQSVRRTRANPLLDGLHNWMKTRLGILSAKSEIAAAIRYALSRWCALNGLRERIVG